MKGLVRRAGNLIVLEATKGFQMCWTENANPVSSSGLRNNGGWTSFTWTLWLFHLMQNECRKLIPLLWLSCQRCLWRGSDRKEMKLLVLQNQNLLMQDSSYQASWKMFFTKSDEWKIQCKPTHLLEVQVIFTQHISGKNITPQRVLKTCSLFLYMHIHKNSLDI